MVNVSRSRGRGDSRKQDRLATGQHLRVSEGDFTVAEWRHDLGRASTGGNPSQALPESLAHQDAAVLTPTRASEGGEVDVPERDHGAAFHGDLVQLVAA